MILAIETSSPVCGAALIQDGSILDREVLIHPRVHAEKLAVITGALLERNGIGVADLGSVAVSAGPGSFTGLRIGMSFAKGLVFAHGIPLIPVNTMLALRDAHAKEMTVPEEWVFVIPSHRDYIHVLGGTEAEPSYIRKHELTDKYSGIRKIFTDREVSGLPDIPIETGPVYPEYIGLRAERTPELAASDPGDVQIFYGTRYRPVRWEPKAE